MLTPHQKAKYARKMDNLKDQIWDIMVDIGEDQKENPYDTPETPNSFKQGPIMDLYKVYREVEDIELKFNGRLK